MLLNFDEEERLIEVDIHWASESESKTVSDAKRALRRLDEHRKGLDSEMKDLQQQREYLMGVIEGRIKPAAIDLPEQEAQDFKTKLRLRVKGVRGLAREKAREDLIPVDEHIEKIQKRIDKLDNKAKPIEMESSKVVKALTDFQREIMEQRGLLRRTRAAIEEISRMTEIFGWQNPYLLARKSFQEAIISRRKLQRKQASLSKREEEIKILDGKIDEIKKELQSVLGQSYEVSLVPLVFKDGKSPVGRRFLQNELTLDDVETLDLTSKISHRKAVGRKADRFASVLLEHRNFISDSLHRIARMCEQRMYTHRLLLITRAMERTAKSLVEAKIETYQDILRSAENCGQVSKLVAVYLEKKKATEAKKKQTMGILDRSRSDL